MEAKQNEKKKGGEGGGFIKMFHLLQGAEAETAAFEISGDSWP